MCLCEGGDLGGVKFKKKNRSARHKIVCSKTVSVNRIPRVVRQNALRAANPLNALRTLLVYLISEDEK